MPLWSIWSNNSAPVGIYRSCLAFIRNVFPSVCFLWPVQVPLVSAMLSAFGYWGSIRGELGQVLRVEGQA